MEQSRPWEANRFSTSQEIPRILWNPKVPHSQVPVTCPYPEPERSNPHPHIPHSWRFILILSSHLRLGLPSCLIHSRLQLQLQTSYVIRVVFLQMEVMTATELTIPDRASWTWIGLSITWDRLYNCPADMWWGLLVADERVFTCKRKKKNCVSTQRSITTSGSNGFAVQLSLHLCADYGTFKTTKEPLFLSNELSYPPFR